MEEKKRSNFTGSIGFVLAAAGSAVGLGNIWRFPYLAAKDGGGVFLLCYVILALTFGFALLTTEIAIGRKTGQSPLTAYGVLHKKWKWIGVLACAIPMLILPYYSAIGGWILKYLAAYLSGNGAAAVADGYFTGFITAQWEPIVWFAVFLGFTAVIVFLGVNKGIEGMSKIMMPILLLLILGISCFSLTLSHTDANGVTRTGLEGLKIYAIPNFEGMTFRSFLNVLLDAMGGVGIVVAIAFFVMVTFAALTSSISIMEAIVASFMDQFRLPRRKAVVAVTIYTLLAGIVVCLGYNALYFELPFPNGSVGQVLDLLDYVSNYVLMPVVAIGTCILVGWAVKPRTLVDEITLGGVKFRREKLYVVMIKFVTPVLLLFLLAQALGLF